MCLDQASSNAKKTKQAAIALANRMARTIYALLRHKTEHQAKCSVCIASGVQSPNRKASAS